MMKLASADPILARFHAALARIYGERLERAILFGSRARGDARADSDYDIAVFLREPKSFRQESGRLAEIETEIPYDTGVVINALPFSARTHGAHTPLMHELRRDGIDL
jgi:predicted nucleotidyltransferase